MSDEAGRAGAQTDEERARAYREQVKQLRAVDIASSLMLDLVTIGYQKLGLTLETADLRDLSDARLLIDLLRATLGVVETELDDMQRRDLHSTLAQMQLSFARAVQLAGPPESPAADKPADPPPEEAHATPPPADQPAAQKPAARKTAAKKPAPRKAAAKKPATKKPAQKQRAPREPGEEPPGA